MSKAEIYTYVFYLPESQMLDDPRDGLYGVRVVATSKSQARRYGLRTAANICHTDEHRIMGVDAVRGICTNSDYRTFAEANGLDTTALVAA